MPESKYQRHVRDRLEDTFPGCIVLKNDAGYRQGIQDLLVLWGPYWATLEVKKSQYAAERPNQRLYVERMDDMSFSRFIYPENEEEVFSELQVAFGT